MSLVAFWATVEVLIIDSTKRRDLSRYDGGVMFGNFGKVSRP